MAQTPWKDTFYVEGYELARSGASDSKIAQVLGITPKTLITWKAKRPNFADALARGRAFGKRAEDKSDAPATFLDYVYGRLPDHLTTIWQQIVQLDRVSNGLDRVQAMLEKGGVNMRKHLFIHALVACNFSTYAACAKIGISYKVFEQWCNDSDFQDMLDMIHRAKKAFVDEALMSLIAERNAFAVVFASKTLNKDQYSEKVTVEHTGEGAAALPLALLDLDVETLKKLKTAVAKRTAKDAAQ